MGDEKDIALTKQEQVALCISFLLVYNKLPHACGLEQCPCVFSQCLCSGSPRSAVRLLFQDNWLVKQFTSLWSKTNLPNLLLAIGQELLSFPGGYTVVPCQVAAISSSLHEYDLPPGRSSALCLLPSPTFRSSLKSSTDDLKLTYSNLPFNELGLLISYLNYMCKILFSHNVTVKGIRYYHVHGFFPQSRGGNHIRYVHEP